jgi:hypothetical protein
MPSRQSIPETARALAPFMRAQTSGEEHEPAAARTLAQADLFGVAA